MKGKMSKEEKRKKKGGKKKRSVNYVAQSTAELYISINTVTR